MIDVIIAARGTMQQMLSDFLMVEKGYNVVGSAHDMAQITRLTGGNKRRVIIFDYVTGNEGFFQSLSEFIPGKSVKVIAICDTIKEGFGLLNKGVTDICVRPKTQDFNERKMFLSGVSMKINKVDKEIDANPRALKNKSQSPVRGIIAIGSSTGGTECILSILRSMPLNAPPILIVQHMPPVFTRLYSQRLDHECKISVWEAADGDQLENGLALVAPGDKQMRLKRQGSKYYVSCTKEEPFGGHIPSVDVLFTSIAKFAPSNTIGVILTGMGKDGAQGLLQMKNAGAYTFGQSEKSSIVYGMPKVAYEIGAVREQGTPEEIAEKIIKRI